MMIMRTENFEILNCFSSDGAEEFFYVKNKEEKEVIGVFMTYIEATNMTLELKKND